MTSVLFWSVFSKFLSIIQYGCIQETLPQMREAVELGDAECAWSSGVKDGFGSLNPALKTKRKQPHLNT